MEGKRVAVGRLGFLTGRYSTRLLESPETLAGVARRWRTVGQVLESPGRRGYPQETAEGGGVVCWGFGSWGVRLGGKGRRLT